MDAAKMLESLDKATLTKLINIVQTDYQPPAEVQQNKTQMKRVGNGVSIYKQSKSKNWYARIHLPAEGIINFRQSTRTASEDEATEKAIELKLTCTLKVQEGIPLGNRKQFKEVAKQVEGFYKNRNNSNDPYYISIIHNHLLPTFGHLPIDQIKTSDIRKWHEGAGLRTQSMVSSLHTVLRRIFTIAHEDGLIKVIPEFKGAEIKKAERREDFSKEQLEEIFELLHKWSNSKERRKILSYYCIFLLETGARTGKEVINIRWCDLRRSEVQNNSGKTGKDWYARISKGKTEKYNKGGRDILISASGNQSKIWEYCLTPLRILHGFENIDEAIKSERRLFEDSKGKVARFDDLFAAFRNHYNLASWYKLYSFRHTYITQKIIRGEDYARICSQCGTSVEMLEKHYSHATIERFRQEDFNDR